MEIISNALALLKELNAPITVMAVMAVIKTGLSQYKCGESVQTGVITNTGNRGIFVKTDEMVLQKSIVGSGHGDSEINFSFYDDKALFKKAEQFSAARTFVRVKYESYGQAPWFAANSRHKVVNIEAAEENARPTKSL